MPINSLSQIASLVTKNFEDFTKSYPQVNETAEAVYQGFDGLLTQFIRLEDTDTRMVTSATMGFGAMSSWIEAYILSCAGHVSSGLSDLRRAIEFACYAMKVSKSEQRALDWLNQGVEIEARKRFALSCSIPLCYEGEKYRLLRDLIYQYETTNYYGAHANPQTLIERLKTDGGVFGWLLHVPKDERRLFAQGSVLTGYRILQVFTQVLSPAISDRKAADAVMDYVTRQTRDMRLSMAELKYQGNVPASVYRVVCLDENPSMDDEFEEIIRQAKGRKAPRSVS